MKDWLIRQLNRVLYSADKSTVDNLLHQLSQPEHLLTRTGHPSRSDFRGVLSDALRDQGRDKEADLVQSNQHVVVHGGQVKPGRWTLQPIWDHQDRLADAILAEGGWEGGHPPSPTGWVNHPRHFIPGAGWVTASPGDDGVDEPHVFDLSRHQLDDDGIPIVDGSTFTCHDFECPAHQAPKEWTDLLVDTMFHPRNRVLTHLPPARRNFLIGLAREGEGLNLEEPVPNQEDK